MFEDEYEQMKGRNKRRREGKGRRKQPETAKQKYLFVSNDEQHKEMKSHEEQLQLSMLQESLLKKTHITKLSGWVFKISFYFVYFYIIKLQLSKFGMDRTIVCLIFTLVIQNPTTICLFLGRIKKVKLK